MDKADKPTPAVQSIAPANDHRALREFADIAQETDLTLIA